MKLHGRAGTVVTVTPRSDGDAVKELRRGGGREMGLWLNTLAENSHLLLRQRERAILQFRCLRTFQKFASVQASAHNRFPTECHLEDRNACSLTRAAALANCRGLFAS